ncbi:MAG TPA: beta-ribofuranosylaminobenzene 5'-phosphate synthase [Thauera sp.]|nr:beta-ribofuranosylaminobenzene 5'-phosphate synthase [Thauera sp.]
MSFPRQSSEHSSDAERCVSVDSPARLHLGFLDPNGSLGRRFASLGLVIDGFSTRLELRPDVRNRIVVADGVAHDATARLERYLATLQRETGLDAPLCVRLLAAPPPHAGFGSGTQLALAIGRAFSSFHGLEIPTRRLAAILGRGKRSGVGIAGFDRGGLLLDGGPGADGSAAPLLSRVAFPAEWAVVLVLDDRLDGLCGTAERVAMDALSPFPRALAADVCHQVLMRVLPGAIEHAFEPFAEGITTIQRLIGDYFAPAQGGSMYTSAAVGRALEWLGRREPAGIGQSSWGPTGFALMRSRAAAEAMLAAARAAGAVDPALRIVITNANNRGAQVGLGAAALARV